NVISRMTGLPLLPTTEGVAYRSVRSLSFVSRSPALSITITERQQEILDEFSRSRSEPYFLRQRSTIILLAFAGLLNEQIALQVGLERHQVGIWRARWAEAFDGLVLVECLEDAATLRKALRELLAD